VGPGTVSADLLEANILTERKKERKRERKKERKKKKERKGVRYTKAGTELWITYPVVLV
jgi:hypothetical protein